MHNTQTFIEHGFYYLESLSAIVWEVFFFLEPSFREIPIFTLSHLKLPHTPLHLVISCLTTGLNCGIFLKDALWSVCVSCAVF